MRFVVDIETTSPCDLKARGALNYALDPGTRILCIAWADADAPCRVESWSLMDGRASGLFGDKGGGRSIESVFDTLLKADMLIAHNAAFERACLGAVDPRFLDARRWRCSAMLAAACARPRGLDHACRALRFPSSLEKDARGKRLLNIFSIQGSASYRGVDGIFSNEKDQREFLELVEYCRQDVRAEHAVWRTLRPFKDKFFDAQWLLDCAVDDFGIPVDTGVLNGAARLFERLQRDAEARASALTGGVPLRSTPALRAWTASKGYALESFSRDAVSEALENRLACDSAPDVEALLRIRASVSGTAGKKFAAFIDNTAPDGRVHGSLVSRGAWTGRYAGRGIQPHNMPRGYIDAGLLPVIRDLAACGAGVDSLSLVAGGQEVDALAGLCRDSICAPDGRVFVIADYSAIEARVLAWLAREGWVNDIFAGDGKIYERTAAAMYGRALERVTKTERTAGKIATLALGYGGGVGALNRFAGAYGVSFSDDEALGIVKSWRASRPKTTALWASLMKALCMPVCDPGFSASARVSVGDGVEISFEPVRISGVPCIRVWLPSGRPIFYWSPERDPETGDVLCEFWGGSGRPSKDVPGAVLSRVYGGVIAENVTQAVAFDLLLHSLFLIDKRRDLCRIVMHVHDEVVVECDEDKAQKVAAFVKECMETAPPWARGLRLVTEPCVSKRYKK